MYLVTFLSVNMSNCQGFMFANAYNYLVIFAVMCVAAGVPHLPPVQLHVGSHPAQHEPGPRRHTRQV